jgi:hypothetical protein
VNSLLRSVLNPIRCLSLSKSRSIRLGTLLLLLSLQLWVPRICQANETCPWLNEATAAGFLDGSATSTVTHPSKDKNDATCEFIIRREGGLLTTLRIEVQTMSAPAAEFASYLAECGSNAQPVKAVGNEAVACSLDGKNGKFSESVVGRVRDRAFVVRVNATGDESRRATIAIRVRKIAEQVAGFLF